MLASMNPGGCSRSLGGRIRDALALLIGVMAMGGLVGVASAAAGTTTIGFDNLTAGEVVKAQYEAQGLKLGMAEEVGQVSPAPGKGDCGSPQVEAESAGAKASSPPNWAVLASCAATGFRGTYGALLGSPAVSMSVAVSDLSVGTPAVEVQLIGYDSAGKEVLSGHANAANGSWTTIDLVLSGEAKLSYFMIRTAAGNAPSIGIDDLSFQTPAGSPSGGGGANPPTTTPSPPSPPSAAIAVSGIPQPGQAVALDGGGSLPGSGHIISYDWDLNGDGKTDTSTGTNPLAHVILAPGLHTIGLTVTSSSGQSSTTKLGLAIPSTISLPPPPDGGEGPCAPTLEEGDAQIVAECVQKLSSGGYVIETKQLELNGMVLAPREGGYGVFKVQSVKDIAIGGTQTLMSGPSVSIELLNTPIGDVVLGGRDLQAEPLQLTAHSTRQLPFPLNHGLRHTTGRARVASEATSKVLLMAFGVGHECSAGESKKAGCCPPAHGNTACASLPGNFPLTGQVVVYLTNKGQALFDVQVGLELKSVNFQATGALEIEADPQTGINLNSLKFTIPEAELASVFKVKEASFVYYFPSYSEESKRDSWQAKGTITFGPLEQPGLEAELAFKHGEFHSASMVFTAPAGAGVPIYPGVELNKLGASVGVNPLSFGGTLGASIATQLELTLAFKFREATSTELGFLGGQGQLSYKDDEIATLAADVYSDGYVDAKLALDLHFPFDSDDPVVKVGGSIGFWDETASGLWQAEGSVYLKLWEINGEVGGLINNEYVAGCADVAGFGAQGHYKFADSSIGVGFFGFSNCSDQLKQYQEKPLKSHSGGFVGESLRGPIGADAAGLSPSAAGARAAASEQASAQSFVLPPRQAGEELRVTATAGTPVFTLTSPGGQSYTTPPGAGHIVTSGETFIAAVASDPDQVLVFLRKPEGGTWHMQPAPGSPPIAKLEAATDVPPAKVTVNVRHLRGSRWSLAYRIANYVPGSRVRLVERGRDSTHVLGTAASPSGTIGFVPQDALSRARRVVAYLLDGEGAPYRMLSVGRFVAPAAMRPGRPGRVRIVRHGVSASVSWGMAKGARAYRLKVRGSDGRVQSLLIPARRHSVVLANVLPFQSLTVTVSAKGGPNLLQGPSAVGRLAIVKARARSIPRRPVGHGKR